MSGPSIINPYWGSDLQILNGDIQASPSGDLVLISNLDNIVQSLTNRFATELGFLDESNTYGMDFDLFIGRKNVDQGIQMLEVATSECISDEPRVASIGSIAITRLDKGQYAVQSEINLKGSPDALDLNFVAPYRRSYSPVQTTISLEPQVSSDNYSVRTRFGIDSVTSVTVANDPTQTDYFRGGSFTDRNITLGTALPQENMPVSVSYVTAEDVSQLSDWEELDFEAHAVIYAPNGSHLTNITLSYIPRSVIGVYLTRDERTKNYFYDFGVAGTISGQVLTLPKPLPVTTTIVYVSYLRLTKGAL